MVTATPALNAPTPLLVVICTDTRAPWETAELPEAIAKQFGSSSVLGPVTVALMPVFVGSSHAQGLVKMVAVTV